MTKRRYHLPILATVIGLVVSGCGVFGGNSDDYTITVTVSGPSASERALGIAAAIAPWPKAKQRRHSGKSRPRWNARRPAGSV